MNDLIMVTDWELVDKDDFYLTDEEWAKNEGEENVKKAKELQANGNLYEGFVVSAMNYAIYRTMDAHQIFIDKDCNEILSCESQIIDSPMNHAEEYNY